MRLKLDENLGVRLVDRFRVAGHDVETVVSERMEGTADVNLMAACVVERRVLVTLDMDFANPLRFPPTDTAGIAVLRVSDMPEHADLHRAADVVIAALGHAPIEGHLWVVTTEKVREYRSPSDSDVGDG